MNICYLHGFNSRGYYDNPKVQALQKLSEVLLVNYNSFGTYTDIITEIDKQIEHLNGDFVLIGSSLGGFFANKFAAKYNCKSVLLNPAYNPGKLLDVFLGVKMTNYEDGRVNRLSKKSLDSYAKHDTPVYGVYKPLVLLAADDDLIPANISAEIYKDSIVKIVEKGGHRLDSLEDHLDLVKNYLSINN